MADIHGAHDLSAPTQPVADNDFDSHDEETQQRLREMADEAGTSNPRERVRNAFVVAVGYDGKISVADYDGDTYEPGEPPNGDVLYAVGAILQKDILVQETAQYTLQAQMVQARAIHEQQQAQRIQQGLNL